MKILLGIIALIACTGIGYFFSRKYSVRKEFYTDFSGFNKNLKSEISFRQDSILNIINKCSERKSIFYKNITEHFIENKLIVLDKNTFNQEEIAFFSNYIENIGASDKNTQISFLEEVDVKLKDVLAKTCEEEKKYKALYIKLGFLCGLIAFIILL